MLKLTAMGLNPCINVSGSNKISVSVINFSEKKYSSEFVSYQEFYSPEVFPGDKQVQDDYF